jgi:hypothetical protein
MVQHNLRKVESIRARKSLGFYTPLAPSKDFLLSSAKLCLQVLGNPGCMDRSIQAKNDQMIVYKENLINSYGNIS